MVWIGSGDATNGKGGDIDIKAGSGTVAAGGDVTLTSGLSTVSTGGGVWLSSGIGSRTSSGTISIASLNSGTSGVSGSVTLISKERQVLEVRWQRSHRHGCVFGRGKGGDISLTAGSGAAASGGDISLLSGKEVVRSTGGGVWITTGYGSSSSSGALAFASSNGGKSTGSIVFKFRYIRRWFFW